MEIMEDRNLKTELKIGVIGLGLIGGSVLKSLYERGYDVIGVSKSSFNKAAEFCTKATSDIKDVKDCNVVFVCSKMSETLSVLKELENIVSSDCIVCDVCSLKRFVNFDNDGMPYKRPYNFIGSHPMAGTEFSGFEHSYPKLFIGAKWILNEENEILENLIKDMGAKPVIMGAKDHDKFACLISHLPMLVSTALMKTAANEDKALKVAASGFRDTTRLSLTDYNLAYDMLSLNSDNFNILIDEFIQNLQKLKNMSKEELKDTLFKLQKIRKSMYDENGKNRL